MKALIITITQSCNYDCVYCTMRGFVYPAHVKSSTVTNAALIKWLKEYINPDEWHIKITGGEPGLYKGIDTLPLELSELGYKGIIETNGGMFIPKSDNFVRVGAWHKDKPIPEYYDVILITKNPDDDWRGKVDYCKSNNIPYKSLPFKNPGLHSNPNYDDPFPGLLNYGYDGMLCVYAAGQFKACPKRPAHGYGDGLIFNMDKPEPCDFSQNEWCSRGGKCTTLLGLKYFMPYVFDKKPEE